jgi:hypothetical protein
MKSIVATGIFAAQVVSFASASLTCQPKIEPSISRPKDVEPRAYVSQVGSNVIARSDLGILGQVKRVSHFKGAEIGRVRVLEVLKGRRKRLGTEILVLAGKPNYFTPADTRIVLFLKLLQDPQYRAVSRITFDTRLGERRYRMLKDVLRVERSGASAFTRAKELKDYFFRVAAEQPSGIQLIALRELAHLSTTHTIVFRRRDLDRVGLLGLGRRSPIARGYIRTLTDRLSRLPDRMGESIRFHQRSLEGASNAETRVQALIAAVKELGVDSVSILIPLLDDPEPQVRELAAFHLGRIGDPVAVPSLLRRERIESVVTARASMLDALGRLKVEAAIPRAEVALKDQELRRSAILALARIRTPQTKVILGTFREQLATSADQDDRDCLKLIDFVASEKFLEQERKLKRILERKQ